MTESPPTESIATTDPTIAAGSVAAAPEIRPAESSIDPRPRRRHIHGLPVEALGVTWLLAPLGLALGFTAERDEVYEDLILTDKVTAPTITQCAYLMLLINYHLEHDQVRAIVAAADREQLVDAVIAGLLFLDVPDSQATYSYWARTALIANNIDPEKIPGDAVAGVLIHLVKSGRAIPHHDFTGAGKFTVARGELLEQL